jgi:hypothetical protein
VQVFNLFPSSLGSAFFATHRNTPFFSNIEIFSSAIRKTQAHGQVASLLVIRNALAAKSVALAVAAWARTPLFVGFSIGTIHDVPPL